MNFYLTADFKFCKVIRFSWISLVMGLFWLCACSSLKFASQKAQPLDRGLSSFIDRNTIPHVHPHIIFVIDGELEKLGYKAVGYTGGGSIIGGVGGYTSVKILQKLIAAKVKPVHAVPPYWVKELTTGGGILAGGAGGTVSAFKEIEDFKEEAARLISDQDGHPIPDIFLQGDGAFLLTERPVDRACAVYYYVNQDSQQELDMQYQEEFNKKYFYVQAPKYQEWLERCPEKQQIISWCNDFGEGIADKHPVVFQACKQLINKEI